MLGQGQSSLRGPHCWGSMFANCTARLPLPEAQHGGSSGLRCQLSLQQQKRGLLRGQPIRGWVQPTQPLCEMGNQDRTPRPNRQRGQGPQEP